MRPFFGCSHTRHVWFVFGWLIVEWGSVLHWRSVSLARCRQAARVGVTRACADSQRANPTKQRAFSMGVVRTGMHTTNAPVHTTGAAKSLPPNHAVDVQHEPAAPAAVGRNNNTTFCAVRSYTVSAALVLSNPLWFVLVAFASAFRGFDILCSSGRGCQLWTWSACLQLCCGVCSSHGQSRVSRRKGGHRSLRVYVCTPTRCYPHCLVQCCLLPLLGYRCSSGLCLCLAMGSQHNVRLLRDLVSQMVLVLWRPTPWPFGGDFGGDVARVHQCMLSDRKSDNVTCPGVRASPGVGMK